MGGAQDEQTQRACIPVLPPIQQVRQSAAGQTRLPINPKRGELHQADAESAYLAGVEGPQRRLPIV